MDVPKSTPNSRYIRLLPYWAVLMTDIRQTPFNWVWRVWVLASLTAGVGYMLYRFGVYREAGVVQTATVIVGDLLRWTAVGTVTLIALFTVGSIASERGTLADSVLSRGISRTQFFLAKLHARWLSVVVTFLVISSAVLLCCYLLLHEPLSLTGCFVALGAVVAVLTAVVSCGVTVSAMSQSTIIGVAILWVGLYGGGFLLSLLPNAYLTPDRLIAQLPKILRGLYDSSAVLYLVGASAFTASAAALTGLIGFSRCDV